MGNHPLQVRFFPAVLVVYWLKMNYEPAEGGGSCDNKNIKPSVWKCPKYRVFYTEEEGKDDESWIKDIILVANAPAEVRLLAYL